MKCPYCNKEGTKVIDSRPAENNTIRRRDSVRIVGKDIQHMRKLKTYLW